MQVSLFGEIVHEGEGRGKVEGECDVRCLKASEPRCVCRCKGRNHGYLNAVKNESLDGGQRYLALGHIKELFEFFRDKICLVCGYPHLEILGYPHHDGVYLKQYGMRVWVFGRCLRCGYDNAFWKFSLPRGQAVIEI